MPSLGVGSALAWLHSFAHNGEVCICQGLSQTPPPDKACEVPPVLCCVCVHTIQSVSILSCFLPLKAKVRGISMILKRI